MRTTQVSLGEVASFIRGVTFKPTDVVPVDTPGSIRCMRTKNVQSDLDLSDVWALDASIIKRKDQYLQPGDLLVSSANSWNLVGKCCWVPVLDWPASFGGFISVLRPDRSRVEPRYLYRWFSSQRIQALVRSFGRQTTNISNLNFERCLQLQIPLPSMSDQSRISEALDRVDEVRIKRREALAQLDDLTQSIFLDMFGDPSANPIQWDESCVLGELASISSGITKGRKPGSLALREVPYMAVLNVQDKRLDLSVVKRIAATENEISRYALRRDDLLLTEGGDPDKLGRGVLWGDELPEAIHQNHIFRVRISDLSRLHPVYLNWLVGSVRGKRYFLQSAKQTTGIASINMAQLRRFPLLLPPIALQHQFADRVQSIEGLKRTYRTSLAEMDALLASVQGRAFRGEL